MMPRSPAPVDPSETVEFVIHGALAPRVIEWLNGQGFDVIDFPSENPEALRCLMVTPGKDLWERFNPPPSITCPKCGRTSHNPNDVEQRYCGACHEYHDTMGLTTP